MASWIEHWVNFRNKKQIEEDAKTFSNSIFPYGEVQKEKAISLLKEQEMVVRCKDCPNKECEGRNGWIVCGITGESHDPDWFCADGKNAERR